MLVLSRKKEESIIVTAGGERIEIVIVDIRGDKARIGVEASQYVTINRKEVQDAIDKTKGVAKHATPES